MKVGYWVAVLPELASYRLRVAIPAQHLGCPYRIGGMGNPTFFYKNGDTVAADAVSANGVVYDVVNDHFRGKYADDYLLMCSIADKITVASESMAETVLEHTGREATVIADPYETEEREPSCYGNGVAWFGHSANLSSLAPYVGTESLVVCSNSSKSHVPWSLENEAKCMEGAAVVLMTGNNPGASANRVVKALRAGRFVVAPKDCADSWRELSPYIWIGDVADGIAWALNNREDVCQKIKQGQQFIQQRFAPQLIGSQWADLFGSI